MGLDLPVNRIQKERALQAVAENTLKARRLEAGLSRRVLAERAQCAPSTVQYIEEGWRGYGPDVGRRIARALGVPPTEL